MTEDSAVAVTGEVRKAFYIAAVESEFGFDHDDALFDAYSGEPYILPHRGRPGGQRRQDICRAVGPSQDRHQTAVAHQEYRGGPSAAVWRPCRRRAPVDGLAIGSGRSVAPSPQPAMSATSTATRAAAAAGPFAASFRPGLRVTTVPR